MAEARLKRIDRSQSYWGAVEIESLIAPDHRARGIWELVSTLPVEEFLSDNKSVAGRAGAERTDPRLLIAVWVYGLTLGIGSARELERQLEREPGLRWLCGDEGVNHHTLSDFRVAHGAALDGLFSRVLAALTKIQAQAGASSLRREPTLRERLRQAEQVVAELTREAQEEGARSKRQAARERAACEQAARLRQALEELEAIRKSRQEPEQARASASEPEARVMKNGQGGFAPSYNAQTMVDAAHKIVVNVELTQQAGDQGQLEAALERLPPRCGDGTLQLLVDGGYIEERGIAAAAERGVELIGPVLEREVQRSRNQRQSLAQAGIAEEFGGAAFRVVEDGVALECPAGQRLRRISHTPRYDQYRAGAGACGACAMRPRCCPRSAARSVKIARPSPVVEAFHQRMREPAAQAVYGLRGAVAEFPHAWWKEKFGLRKFHVRGLAKARLELKWAALAYNIQQWFRLIWKPRLATA